MIASILSSSAASEELLSRFIEKKLDSINNLQLARGRNEDVFVYPTDYPSSVSALSRAVSVSDSVVFVLGDSISALDAELALAVEFSDISAGVVVHADYSDTSSFKQLFASYKVGKMPILKLGDQVPNVATGGGGDKFTYVGIDKHFIVKGIGTVLLGLVFGSSVNKGDGMFLLPSGKEVTIKSIQVMDVNVSSAPAGSHVGLALNNVNERDMEDNYAVASIKEVAKDYRIDLERSELFKGDLSASKSMIAPVFGRNFQVTVSSDLKAISFAKPIVKLSRKIILFDSSLPVGKNRVAGRFSLL